MRLIETDMNKKTKIRLVIGTILFTITYMIFAPFGSIYPSELEFYGSIGAGIIWGVLMYISIKKFAKS